MRSAICSAWDRRRGKKRPPEGRRKGNRVTKTDTFDRVTSAAANRILVLDGAMGTEIQNLKLDEAAFRGERFKDWESDLKGNNDLLNLTHPHAIRHVRFQLRSRVSSSRIVRALTLYTFRLTLTCGSTCGPGVRPS